VNSELVKVLLIKEKIINDSKTWIYLVGKTEYSKEPKNPKNKNDGSNLYLNMSSP